MKIQLQVYEREYLRGQHFFDNEDDLLGYLAVNYILSDDQIAQVLAGTEVPIGTQTLKLVKG